MLSETEVRPPAGYQPNAPFNRATIGLVVLKNERKFNTILLNVSMAVDMPAEYSYDYSITDPRGILMGDTLIFAYEPTPNAPWLAKRRHGPLYRLEAAGHRMICLDDLGYTFTCSLLVVDAAISFSQMRQATPVPSAAPPPPPA